MKLVSPLLKKVVYPGLFHAGYFRSRTPMFPVVVTYHGVVTDDYKTVDANLDGNLVTVAVFKRQLHLLKSHYNVISPKQFLDWQVSRRPLPARSVLLTCDDGLQNSLSVMVPALTNQGFTCLFFVTGVSLSQSPKMLWYEELYLMLHETTGLKLHIAELNLHVTISDSDQKFALWWRLVQSLSRFSLADRAAFLDQIRVQQQLPEKWNFRYLEGPLRSRFSLLTLEEVRTLADKGMTVGAHSLSHPMLSRQPDELSRTEIRESKAALQTALNLDVWGFAYPFGDLSSVTEREFKFAEDAGFACAFLNVEQEPCSRFSLPRVHVTAQMSLPEFEAHISGFYSSLRQRFSYGGPALQGNN